MGRKHTAGFTYTVVLVMLATTAVMAGVTEQYVSQMMLREKEAELLFRGDQYVNAIQSYYEVRGQLPFNLEDLKNDPRFLNRHHIRELYPDPMVPGDIEWSLIRDGNGAITGVASSSDSETIKRANFPMRYSHFTGLERYSDWKFVFDPMRFDMKLRGGALNANRER